MNKKNLLYWAVAAVVTAGICLICLAWRPDKKVDIVFMGDSVIGNVGYANHCTDIVAQRTGKTVFNGAFSGSRMADSKETQAFIESSMWSMVKLAKAICYQDFTAPKMAVSYGDYYKTVNNNTLSFFKQRMQDLSEIDFSKTDILIIQHGTNDYNMGCVLESPENPFDINTFAGALRITLQLFREKYPELRIILVTPIYCELGAQGEYKCYETDFGGGTLDEFVAKEKEIAALYGVEVLDAYNESGIWEENADRYLSDNLHLTEEGHVLLGNFIADYLLK